MHDNADEINPGAIACIWADLPIESAPSCVVLHQFGLGLFGVPQNERWISLRVYCKLPR
jgi:hypothetical protein